MMKPYWGIVEETDDVGPDSVQGDTATQEVVL